MVGRRQPNVVALVLRLLTCLHGRPLPPLFVL